MMHWKRSKLFLMHATSERFTKAWDGEVYQGMGFEFAEKIRFNPANKEDLMAQYNQLIAQTRRMSLNFLLLMRE